MIPQGLKQIIDLGDGRTIEIETGKLAKQADGSVKPEATMDPSHVVNSVYHIAQLPLDANVQFMTVMATSMPYIGRG